MKRTEKQWEDFSFFHERDLQSYVHKRLKQHRDAISFCKVMAANIKGVSDELLNVQGRFTAIELKVRDNTPTEHQKKFLEWVQNTGGIAGVAYTWGEVKALIRAAGYDMDEVKTHGKNNTHNETG